MTYIDPLPHNGHGAREKADVGQARLHDNGGHLGLLDRVAGLVQAVQHHRVPAGLLDGEVPLQLQVQGVVGPHLGSG